MTMRLSLLIDGDNTGAKKATEEEIAALKRLGDQAQKTGKQAADGLKQPAEAAAGAVKLSAQQLANMQFQLQDMAVGLASGQSPFTVMMQQGSQLAQGFTSGTGVLGALKAVGGGIVQFLTNPLNLAVLGAGVAASALGAVASTIMDKWPSANKVIEDHAELVKHIGEEWDAARKKAIAYSDESRATMLFQATAASKGLQGAFATEAGGLQRLLAGARGKSFVDIQGGAAGKYAFGGAGLNIDDLVKGFVDDLRAGKSDVLAFRDAIASVGAASDDQRVKDLVTALLDQTKAAADAQQELQRNSDLVRGLKGDNSLLNEALGKTSAGIRTLTGDLKTLMDEGGFIGGLARMTNNASYSGQASALGLGAAPSELRQLIIDAAARFKVDADLLARVAYQESHFNSNAQSSKGAQGVMQLMPGTARQMGVLNPFDAGQNINGGAAYLAQLLRMFGGNQELALMGYNWGGGNVQKWLHAGGDPEKVPKETRDYVSSINGGGSIMRQGDAAARKDEQAKERAAAQDERWAEIVRKGTEAIKARADGIGKTVGEQQKLQRVQELWAEARSAYGDRLNTDKALMAKVTDEINKQAEAYGKNAQAIANEKAQREFDAKWLDLEAKRRQEARDAQIKIMDEVRDAGSSFLSTFTQAVQQTHSLKAGLKAAVDELAGRGLQVLDDFITKLAFGEKGSSNGGLLGGITNLLTGLFNMGGSAPTSIYAKGGAFAGGVQAFAKGAGFTNKIINTPTLFRFGRKLGVMGEEKPEAVMPLINGQRVGAIGPDGQTSLPLTRLPDGSLGVAMPSGAGPQAFAKGDVFGNVSNSGSRGLPAINVNTHNYGNENAETKVSQRRDGSIDIDTIIGRKINDHVAKGGLDDVMAGRFGTRRRSEKIG